MQWLSKLEAHATAIRLIELGARAGLVCHVTSLPRATVKTCYEQIHGRSSPPGMSPFSDAWYVRTNRRMLHANIVWKLLNGGQFDQDGGQRLIKVYEAYLCFTGGRALLDLARAYFVPQLLRMGLWRPSECRDCETTYIGPTTDVQKFCPACCRQRAYRCAKCGAAVPQTGVGRRIEICRTCRHSLWQDNKDGCYRVAM